MKKCSYRISFAFICLLLSVGFAGCNKQEGTLPNLSGMGEVYVISREDGSGTRDQFASLIQTTEAGTDIIVGSTEEVLKEVSANLNAIGYVAISALNQNSSVKNLAVDQIVASTENIRNRKYALSRNYYLAWSGNLSPVEQDFMRYITGAGQKIVAKRCIPVAETATFLSDKSAGTISISGSSSMAPFMKELAAAYMQINSNANIQVQTTDSTKGLIDVIRGECDIAMSSRELKSYELELLESKIIAMDGIAIIVNKENPLESLSVTQIRALFDGDCQLWDDLR